MFLKVFTIFAFIFLLPTASWAAAPVGAVTAVEGNASIRRDNSEYSRAMEADTKVFMRDFVKTQADSKVMILFDDDTELTLGADTSLTIDKYIYDPSDPARNKSHFSVLRGSFLFVSGLISKKDSTDVRIDTAYGHIGVRGTAVWGGPVDGSYGVYVQKGEISFTADTGTVIVPEGQGIVITGRGAPLPAPAVWPASQVEKALKSVSVNEGGSDGENGSTGQHGTNQEGAGQEDAGQKGSMNAPRIRNNLPVSPPPPPVNFHLPSGSY